MILEKLKLLVNELNTTTSTNDKVEVLKKYSDDKEVKDMLISIYSPYIHFGVGSKNCKKLSHLTTALPHDTIFNLLKHLDRRTFTGHSAIEMVNGFVEANKEYKELIYNILDKDLKTRAGASLINKAIPGLVPQFKVALAETFNGHPDYENEDWLCSRKLDGVRCIAICDNMCNIKMYSRQGKEFNTLANVKKELIYAMKPGEVWDGEICIMDKDGNENFQDIMKEIRRKDHTIKYPKYVVFDKLTLEEFNSCTSSRILSDRVKEDDRGLITIDFLPFTIIKDDVHLQEMTDEAEKLGHEGIMLRKDCEYKGKRSKDILKVKKFHDAEYKVIDIEMGTVRYVKDGKDVEEEMLSNIIIEHKGNQVGVGSGFTIGQRQEFFEDPSKILDKLITVQYFEESKNKAGEYSLRFPVLKHIYNGTRNT